MGRGMCKNIVEKANLEKPLIVFNRTPKRAHDLVAKFPQGKAKVFESQAETVKEADIIFTCVGDDAAIKNTIESCLKESVKGKIFVDCSTVHPDTTNMLAKAIEAQGAQFVACPVFGAPPMADAGQLVCVLAGPKEAVEQVRPYCKGVMARAEIDYSGQPQGTATHLKIVGNCYVINMVETLAETHVLAQKSGLGSENLEQFIEVMWGGPYVGYSKRMMAEDYIRDQPLFGVDLARKDAKHALSLAAASGTKMKGLEVAEKHLEDVQGVMGSRGDLASIYGIVRKESGLPFEVNKKL